jgi:hypothetical protein
MSSYGTCGHLLENLYYQLTLPDTYIHYDENREGRIVDVESTGVYCEKCYLDYKQQGIIIQEWRVEL